MTITSAEIAIMRDTIELLLPDTCNILSVTTSPDGMGGVTQTWGTASSNVSCRLDMKSGRELVTGGALQPYTSYKLSLPYDATIIEGNRVVHNSITYAVTSVNNAQSWQAVTRVDLEVV